MTSGGRISNATIVGRETGWNCTLCGAELAAVSAAQPGCPQCQGQPRTRTLPIVVEDFVDPLYLGPKFGPLLAFSMPTIEEKVIRPSFPDVKSVSLYGRYRSDHIEGVDIRDLSRFSDDSFCAIFGSLIFDYFLESDTALAECLRVLKPGGVLFTHIAPNRMLPGYEPPRVKGVVEKRKNYFDYVPDNTQMPSIAISAAWFHDAMRAAGFLARHVVLKDSPTGMDHDWFIGQKPALSTTSAAIVTIREAIEPAYRKVIRPETRQVGRHRVALPLGSGLRRLELEISAYRFPEPFRDTQFAEHVVRGDLSEVVCLHDNTVLRSDDDGQSFRAFGYESATPLAFWNAFSPEGYDHKILQTRGWSAEADARPESEDVGRLYLMEPSGRIVASGQCSSGGWHGSRSIDQAGNTIIFGDYHVNTAKFREANSIGTDDYKRFVRPSFLFRSTDGGYSWKRVMEVSPQTVRHFHTVVADAVQPGVWWASTGDFPKECKVFVSKDDGLNWSEVGTESPNVPPPPGDPSRLQACFRHTAMVQTETDIRWGADDIYGMIGLFNDDLPVAGRTGARLYVAKRTCPLQPVEVGYCGHPVRSIVDVGPGYILLTESYYRKTDGSLNPEVKFWSKYDPSIVVDICRVANIRDTSTGFTYSRASRISNFGTFFTYRGADVAARGRTRLLKWNVRFD